MVYMSANLAAVLAAAEALPTAERRELIALLLDGLDESPESSSESPGLTEAWKQEIARRSEEYDAGRAETVRWEDVQARWQSRRGANGG
jgi:putative addiction module component (TIGR02574 family)